jgi:hypothetical protein
MNLTQGMKLIVTETLTKTNTYDILSEENRNYYFKNWKSEKILKPFKRVRRNVTSWAFEMKTLICKSKTNIFFVHVLQARGILIHNCYSSFSANNIYFQRFSWNAARSRSRIVIISGDVFTTLLMMVPLRRVRLTDPEVMTSRHPALLN